MSSAVVDMGRWANLQTGFVPPSRTVQLDPARLRPRTVSAAFRPYSSSVLGRCSSHSQTRAATAVGVKRSCSRVQQVAHEPTRRHNLQNHLPTKKNRQPPWQKSLETELVPWVVAPGYILSKSKSKVEMYIKMQEFFNPGEKEKPPTDHAGDDELGAASAELLADLQTQIDNLTVFLEEERLCHKETRTRAAAELQEKTKALEREHKDAMRKMNADYEAAMTSLQKTSEEEMSEQKATMEAAISKARKEADFVRMTFDTYKQRLEQETEQREVKGRTELSAKHSAELQSRLKQLKTTMAAEMSAMKADLGRDLQRETSRLKKEHKRETEALVRKYSNAIEDKNKLEKAEQLIEELKLEAGNTRSDYDVVCSQMSEVTRQQADTKMELSRLQYSFQEHVDRVAEQFKGQIDDMRVQNTELRRLYTKKCDQLFEEKANTEFSRLEQLTSAKQTMKMLIEVRSRCGVSVAASCVDDGPAREKGRAGSAPVTRPETRAARSTAGQTDAAVERGRAGASVLRPQLRAEGARGSREEG